MPDEALKQIQEDRKKRVDKNKDKSNLIADNGLADRVFDVYDLINDLTNPVARKLKNLMEYGVTEEIIAENYATMTPNVQSMEEAYSTLESVFIKLATEVSNNPNGIVIDLRTGEKNERLSNMQAKRVGLDEYEDFETRAQRFAKKDMEMDKFREDFLGENGFDFQKFFTGSSKKNENWFWEKSWNNDNNIDGYKKISDGLKEAVNSKKVFLNSIDNNKLALYRLGHELYHARGTIEYELCLRNYESFIKEHPECQDIVVFKEDGELNPEVDKAMDAERDYKLGYLLAQVVESGFTPNTIEEKKFLAYISVAAMKIPGYREDALKALGVKEVGKELYEYINSAFGTKISNESNLQDKIDLFSKSLEHAVDIDSLFDKTINGKITDKEINKYIERIGGEKFTITSIENMYKQNSKSNMDRHFEKSALKFTIQDETSLNALYRNTEVNAWLDSKEDVRRMFIASYFLDIEDLEALEPKTKGIENKIKMNKKRLDIFKKENPGLVEEYLDENGELKPEIRKEAEEYRTHKAKSEMLRDFMRDLTEDGINSKEEFDGMTNVEKRNYLRQAIAGLEYVKGDSNTALGKLIYRRLELLNTDQEQFVDLSDPKNPVINKDLILQTFTEYSSATSYDSYEHLAQVLSVEVNEFNVKGKLKNYLREDSSTYESIDDLKTTEDKIARIESIKSQRAAAAAERFHDAIFRTSESNYKFDPHLIARDENELINNQTKEVVNDESDVRKENTDELLPTIPKQGFWAKLKGFFTRDDKDSKPGFFSRLFGKNEEEVVVEEVINVNEEASSKKNTFDSMLKVDNSGSKIEQAAREQSSGRNDTSQYGKQAEAEQDVADK